MEAIAVLMRCGTDTRTEGEEEKEGEEEEEKEDLLPLCSSMTLASEGNAHFGSLILCSDSDDTVRGSTSNQTIRYTSPSGLQGGGGGGKRERY